MKRDSITQTSLDFQIQETNETLTSHSGLAVVQEMALALGVVRDIAEQLPQTGSNRGFAPEEYVMPLVLMFSGRGRAMEEIREIEQGKWEMGTLPNCRTHSALFTAPTPSSSLSPSRAARL